MILFSQKYTKQKQSIKKLEQSINWIIITVVKKLVINNNNNLLNNERGDGYKLCEHEFNMLSHEVMGKKNMLCITGLSSDVINMVHYVLGQVKASRLMNDGYIIASWVENIDDMT